MFSELKDFRLKESFLEPWPSLMKAVVMSEIDHLCFTFQYLNKPNLPRKMWLMRWGRGCLHLLGTVRIVPIHKMGIPYISFPSLCLQRTNKIQVAKE